MAIAASDYSGDKCETSVRIVKFCEELHVEQLCPILHTAKFGYFAFEDEGRIVFTNIVHDVVIDESPNPTYLC